MKVFLFLSLFSTLLFAAPRTEIWLPADVTDHHDVPFVERESALAMNIRYDGFTELRETIASTLKLKLKFFEGWSKTGEAHVTTITPPEYNTLSSYVSWQRINEIARDLEIQKSDLEVLGLGSGKKMFGTELGETFFVVVRSENLLRIRRQIYQEYLRKGGPLDSFDPEHFYPHITVGFTHNDIHEQDGLIKNMKMSRDNRFLLQLR